MATALCWWNWVILCLLLRHVGCGWKHPFPCEIVDYNSTIKFDCYGLRLREVPTWIARNATEICLGENRIKNISAKAFDGLWNLTRLNLNWANDNRAVQIADGAFSHLANLQELNLCGIVLQNVPENLPRGLKVLHLRNNRITSVSRETFSELKNINELDLSKNCYYWNRCGKEYDAGNRSFSNLTELNYLNLAYNNLSSVPEELPSSLHTLHLGFNRIRLITSEDFRRLTNLNVLLLLGNCQRCHNSPYPCEPCENIEIHDRAFHSLTKLETLNLAGNSLRIIKKSWFASLRNLKILGLSFNFLSDPITTGGFMDNLPHLELIDLSYNYALKEYPSTCKLSADFSKLVSLRVIHLQGYVFKEICHDTLSALSGLRNLTVLDLGTNFIVHADSAVFKKFGNVKLIYLSENRLYPTTNSSHEDRCRKLYGDNGMGVGLNPGPHVNPLLTGPGEKHKMDDRYSLTHALVKHECFASGRVLDLSSNNIFFISPVQFVDFENISCLNLSRNGFAAALNGTEFLPLSNLKYLDLSYNKIDLAYDGAFSELKKLEVLDLSYNPHYFIVSGVTHNFNFLENLPSLKVLNLSNNNIFTLTSKTMKSNSLTELQFHDNRLGILWKVNDGSYDNLFKYLLNLSYLDISHNGIKNIPQKIMENLPKNITKLCLGYNSIDDFGWHNLTLFPNLQFLDLSHNLIAEVPANLSGLSKTLETLDLSHNRIARLPDGFLRGAGNVRVLDLSYNLLVHVNRSACEAAQTNYTQVLRLGGNPFHCMCDTLDFILWLRMSRDVKIPRLAKVVNCALPPQWRGKSVIDFDITQCIDDSVAFLFYFLSATVVILTTASAVTMHLFYWDASYALRYWRARLRGYRRLASGANDYDAFVAYDAADPLVSEWVLNSLRAELEERGDRLHPVCLEERDWTPGTPVLDNLSRSVGRSRKTVFVLTERYARSGAFRMAAYLAHQRLLEENEDVIVLLLLEPVLRHSRFLRLRRRLCGPSVLDWPRNPAAQRWFWQCLRNAIRVDNQAMYSKEYSRYFTSSK
ncbi:toll-like receptor 8 [Anguilla rostrata]|uniref:toll-like receptor 8 n=1 Tax=Anguilla rostrata TaxID=7938 RepID=UPI0030CEE766